jgi:hypothetical protein
MSRIELHDNALASRNVVCGNEFVYAELVKILKPLGQSPASGRYWREADIRRSVGSERGQQAKLLDHLIGAGRRDACARSELSVPVRLDS